MENGVSKHYSFSVYYMYTEDIKKILIIIIENVKGWHKEPESLGNGSRALTTKPYGFLHKRAYVYIKYFYFPIVIVLSDIIILNSFMQCLKLLITSFYFNLSDINCLLLVIYLQLLKKKKT